MTNNTNVITMNEVISKVEIDSRGKRDLTANIFKMDNNGLLWVGNNSDGETEQMKLNRHAASQIFQRYGMPSKYFSNLLHTDPELTAYHFNKVIEKQPQEDLFVRTKTGIHTDIDDDGNEETEDSDIPVIRGVMSDMYAVLDNDMVTDALQAVISKFGNNYQIASHYLDDRRMHVRILFPTTARQFGFTKDNVGDILQVGIDIVNSEVGLSSMNIAGLVWRLVCSNGLRRMDRGETFIQRHIHLDTPTFYNRVGQAMTKGIQSGIDTMINFTNSKKFELVRPLESMKVIGKQYDLTNAIVEKAQERWEHDATAYGVINSFTAAARGLDNERRLELEKTSGRLLNLSTKDWKRIDTLAEEYSELDA